ncbi:MAG: nickel pincer cofactor biosynthesis protein LarC [Candidatus Competibacter denitrificans]
MSVLYYDCFAGISGDTHLAALLDLGVDYDELTVELASLGLEGYGLQASRANRKGISGTQVRVVIDPQQPPRRDLAEIEGLISASSLKENVRGRALAVFQRLAATEARLHGTLPEQLQLHEVGALNTIVDIVAGAIALSRLNVDRILCSPVQMGGGLVECEIGILPVPVPTTLELLKGMPLRFGAVPFEATTPTGAALLATFVDQFVAQPKLSVNRVGYGIGHREGPIPDVLRVYLGELDAETDQGELCLLECSIDDMNPECYDHVLDLLSAAGARDLWLTPVLMKRNRPAMVVSVLCAPALVSTLTELLLTETTALAVSRSSVACTTLVRENARVVTRYGQVSVKIAHYQGRPLRGKPQYEDCKRLALERGVPIHAVYAAVREALATREMPQALAELSL